jgi:hypothetical protein
MKPGNIILFVLCGIAVATGVIIYLEASAFQKNSRVAMGVVANSGMTLRELIKEFMAEREVPFITVTL